jgi:hypothetical protein
MLDSLIARLIDVMNATFSSIPEKSFLVIVLGVLLLICHAINFKFLVNRSTIYLTLMLPVTVLLITQAISTNFYLSLGLIGALSIVRYRTPVKSQYELAYLFALIGIGVISGVNPGYAVLLTLILCLLPLVFPVLSTAFPFFKNENLNFNSSGKVEVNLLINIGDADVVDESIAKGRMVRVDMNYHANQAFYLVNFDSLEEAERFRKSLTISPISLSISNS